MDDSTKVEQHFAIIRRNAEEIQMFAGAAIAGLSDPVSAQSLLEIQSQFDEVIAIANRMKRELNEIRSYLGVPQE